MTPNFFIDGLISLYKNSRPLVPLDFASPLHVFAYSPEYIYIDACIFTLPEALLRHPHKHTGSQEHFRISPPGQDKFYIYPGARAQVTWPIIQTPGSQQWSTVSWLARSRQQIEHCQRPSIQSPAGRRPYYWLLTHYLSPMFVGSGNVPGHQQVYLHSRTNTLSPTLNTLSLDLSYQVFIFSRASLILL